jgi:Mg2+-importing ATPase
VVLVVRTRHPFFRSRPGKRLQAATLGVIFATLGLPFLPFAPLLGLTPLPLFSLALLTLIVAMYICSAELAKRLFYRHVEPLAARQPIGTATI